MGWDYDSVLPYFIKAEHNTRLGGPLHGTEGPLHVEDRLFTHELSQAWIDAAVEWGLPRNDDFNGASQIGAGAYQVTCHGGRRWSTADAYLRSAVDRPNLVVRTGAQVIRVLFDGTRATGVAYLHDGAEATVRADSEVILSGGVVNSPQLLLLSGVGPTDQLRGLGVDVVADLPGVGETCTTTPWCRWYGIPSTPPTYWSWRHRRIWGCGRPAVAARSRPTDQRQEASCLLWAARCPTCS